MGLEPIQTKAQDTNTLIQLFNRDGVINSVKCGSEIKQDQEKNILIVSLDEGARNPHMYVP